MLGFPITLLSTGDPAPEASNVVINGDLYPSETLTGDYDYSSPISAPESGSTYKWYRANDAVGTGSAAIGGATSLTYLVDAADLGKYLSFEVTPSDGTHTGEPASSDWEGPIIVDPAIFNITVAQHQTSSANLRTLSGNVLSATACFIGADQTAKRLYFVNTAIGAAIVVIFTYTSLDNLSTGVAYVGTIDIHAIYSTFSNVATVAMSPDGEDFYWYSSSLYHFTLSTPWDFTTLAFSESITIADIQTNSHSATFTFLNGISFYNEKLYWSLRLGNTGVQYYICEGPLGGSRSVSGYGISMVESPPGTWKPSPSFLTASSTTRIITLAVNPQNGHIYGHRGVDSPEKIAEYISYSLTGTEINTNTDGWAGTGDIVATEDGIYVLGYYDATRVLYCYRNP